MKNLARLREFVHSFTSLIERADHDEEYIFADGRKLLSELLGHDDWLPDDFAQPDSEQYRQYLLFCDPLERFSVVSFVWGPGQTTPIHNHTVWGMIGVLRGAETCEEFEPDPATHRLLVTRSHQLACGDIDLVSPRVGDIHRVANAKSDSTSLSIHVYGANIGAVERQVYDPNTGDTKPFVSGYSNAVIPNIWDRSTEPATNA
jgi:predicted metal-dependent enzyme (double-stranded beta helix superfamily)